MTSGDTEVLAHRRWAQGWPGEVAAIETTMAPAAQKLAAMRDRAAQP